MIVLSDGGEFERSVMENCHLELELKKESDVNTEGSFLNLGIKIRNNRFSGNLYYKQNDFPFSVARMAYLRSNTPSKIFYSAFEQKF